MWYNYRSRMSGITGEFSERSIAMERIIRVWVVLAVFGVLAGGPRVEATIVELPLDCAGEYGLGTETWRLDFDLGVEFTEISRVYMDWSGEATGGLYLDFYSTDPHPVDSGIYAAMGSSSSLYWSEVWAGAATHPEPEFFAVLSDFEHAPGLNWSNLLDGRDEIRINSQGLYGTGSYVEVGSVMLTSATLVVEGTLVPEPATVALLGLGGVLLAVRRRRS